MSDGAANTISGVNAALVGIGTVILALFPLSIPFLLLTVVFVLPLILIPAIAALPFLVIAGVILAVRRSR